MNIIKNASSLFVTAILLLVLSSFVEKQTNTQNLSIRVKGLKNNTGRLQFTLYNKEGSIPDEHFEKFLLQLTSPITNKSSSITFKQLPKGFYAINLLHDENEDGKIEKGWILPVEGIGFSNLTTINLLNRPSFKKTKFELKKDTSIEVSIIYM